jgi:hypothetical protein
LFGGDKTSCVWYNGPTDRHACPQATKIATGGTPMVQRKDLLSLGFYRLSPFHGSDRALSYRIEKIEESVRVETLSRVFDLKPELIERALVILKKC